MLGLLASSSAWAERPSSQWGLGGLVISDRKPYRDFDQELEALPFVLYESRQFRVLGPAADLKLVSRQSVTASLRLRYADDGYTSDDSPFLVGMADRKASFWLGGSASWKTPWVTMNAEALGDISSRSRGGRASLGVERSFAVGDIELTPRVTVHAFDKNYVDYYYGVRATEATAIRAAYVGKSATNLEIGVRLGYALAPRHRLSLDVNATRLDSRIKASPIVGKGRQDGLRLAYLYLL
jgi:outer membrane protein